MPASTVKYYPENKVNALNLIEDIKAAIVEKFSPIMLKLKFRNDGTLHKKSKVIVDQLISEIREVFELSNNFRLYLSCRHGIYFSGDLWVVTKIREYDDPRFSADHSGEYLKFNVYYNADQNLLSFDKCEKITLEGLTLAKERFKKLKEEINEKEALLRMIRREFNLDEYGDFI